MSYVHNNHWLTEMLNLICLVMQRYYLASSKELMRINGTTKSALANHLGESIAGAITIRAFQEEDRFFEKNLELVDKNAGPYFYNFAATEWLIQRLETMSAAVLSFSALVMALLPQGTFSPGEQLHKLHFASITHSPHLYRQWAGS